MTKISQTTESSVLAEINIAPFTDVLLVLLIVFMILASLAIPAGFERAFSCACTTTKPVHAVPPVEVTITRRGSIAVDGKFTTATGIYAALAAIHARDLKARISLYADTKAPYGSAIRVLDAAKAAGIADVSFVTQ